MAVTVAILGGGFMGATHAGNYGVASARARVKTVCSRSAERAQRVAETVGAGFTTDLEAVIADRRSTPSTSACRRPSTARSPERAFAAGKHVLPREAAGAHGRGRRGDRRGGRAERARRSWSGSCCASGPSTRAHRRVASGELGRPCAGLRVPALAARRLGGLVRGSGPVRRPARRSHGARLRPAELAARRAAQRVRARRDRGRRRRTGPRRRGRRATTARRRRRGEHADAGAPSLLEPDPGPGRGRRCRVRVSGPRRPRAAATSARSIPALAACGCSRTAASRTTIAGRADDPWGAEIEEFVVCLEAGRPAGAAGPASRRSWRSGSRWRRTARSRAAGWRRCDNVRRGSSPASTRFATRRLR